MLSIDDKASQVEEEEHACGMNNGAPERTAPDFEIEALPVHLSVCKVSEGSAVDLSRPFTFVGVTDQERSLVCPTDSVPQNTTEREDGWRAFRIVGELDFSLVGVLARITNVLAEKQIGIFAISTFNTDYVLTRNHKFEAALQALSDAGYRVRRDERSER